MTASIPSPRSVLVDLTASPYDCDPTGERDCTEAIRQAFDDAMREDRRKVLEMTAYLNSPDGRPLSFEARPGYYVLAPHLPLPVILYLPKGTYRVSGTLGYSFTDMVNSAHDHYARMIHLRGESRGGVILRLEDHCPGFDDPQGKPVIEVLRGLKTAIAMQNTVENLTVETGHGNPGAIGIDFFSNNTGALRDVTVRSGDGKGIAGIAIRKWNSSCALIHRARIEGFRFGVQFLHHRLHTTLEDIEVEGQSRAGIHITDHNVSLHRFRSRNRVPALTVTGSAAHLAAVDVQAEGGDSSRPAIDVRGGIVFLRDVVSSGYSHVLAHRDGYPERTSALKEWTSHPAWKLFPDTSALSLRLPAADPPADPAGDPADLSALAGDGTTDDTDALEAALASGSARLVFPRGRFLLSRPLRIPAHVRELDFQFGSLVAGGDLAQRKDEGTFLVGDGDPPLLIRRLFTNVDFQGSQRLIVQDGIRTLVLRDLHTQNNPMYRNTVPGSRLFIENCACTCQDNEDLPGFAFHGQQVWARQLNPERAHVQVLNDGGDLWVLGFKVENPSTGFLTRNGGRTEILGGIFNQNRNYNADGKSMPTVINENSEVTVSASTTDFRINRSFEGPGHVVVREIRGDQHMDLAWEVLPLRQPHLVAISLYTGRPSPRKPAP